jgi:hypothetical protein
MTRDSAELIDNLNSDPKALVPWGWAVEVFTRVHRIRSDLKTLTCLLLEIENPSRRQFRSMSVMSDLWPKGISAAEDDFV